MLPSVAVPELPEVETVRRSLLPHLEGRRVVGVEARHVRLRQGIEPEEWRAFEGVVVRTIRRRGKYLAVIGDEVSAVLHLGMSGRLAIAQPGQPEAAHTHLVVHLDSGRELRFVDPRRFGSAVVRPTTTLVLFPPLASLGTEPLDDAAGGFLRDAAGRSRVAIRNLLLDQTVLAGIGNIYANEALHAARIHPGRAAGRISRERYDRLAAEIRAVLRRAIAAGGSSLRDFVRSDGRPGYFQLEYAVYGREGEPCPVCGGLVRCARHGGRSTFHCPACQR